MKKNLWIAPIVLVLALILNSCGTQQKATAPVTTPVVQEPVVAVEPLKEVISIADALDMYQNPDKVDAITKKYGYKLKTNYEVYRLDKFSKMYYKNCALAKLLTADKYEDYPKPMRKGVSSYVAFKDDRSYPYILFHKFFLFILMFYLLRIGLQALLKD